MKEVTEQSIEQVIPEPTPEIHSFVGYNIQLLSELDRELYADLENLDDKEPLLSVSNGERNYIYSFTKAVKAIEKEILSIENNFWGVVGAIFCALLLSIFVFLLLFSGKGSVPELVPVLGVCLAAVVISSIVHLVKFQYLKKIKELKQKKTLVFTYGQDYIKTKKEEYKKPVVVV
jgi:hypothetical protein